MFAKINGPFNSTKTATQNDLYEKCHVLFSLTEIEVILAWGKISSNKVQLGLYK